MSGWLAEPQPNWEQKKRRERESLGNCWLKELRIAILFLLGINEKWDSSRSHDHQLASYSWVVEQIDRGRRERHFATWKLFPLLMVMILMLLELFLASSCEIVFFFSSCDHNSLPQKHSKQQFSQRFRWTRVSLNFERIPFTMTDSCPFRSFLCLTSWFENKIGNLTNFQIKLIVMVEELFDEGEEETAQSWALDHLAQFKFLLHSEEIDFTIIFLSFRINYYFQFAVVHQF
jgi:hypothetical protein